MPPLRIFISSVQVMLFADRLDVMNTGQLPPPLTVEKLRVPHESLPRNPLLAESMYLAGYIERMGTGTVDMIRRCVASSLREPEFVASGGFVTTIRRPDYATQLAKVQAGVQDGGQPESQASREKTREKILALIAVDSSITMKELANRLEITPKGIEWQIREMKRKGILERIGPDRGGYWKIIKTDNE